VARTITYREAINEALAQEMERDESVIVMGEDNAGAADAAQRTACGGNQHAAAWRGELVPGRTGDGGLPDLREVAAGGATDAVAAPCP
jgi:hypothetical protein